MFSCEPFNPLIGSFLVKNEKIKLIKIASHKFSFNMAMWIASRCNGCSLYYVSEKRSATLLFIQTTKTLR